MGNEPQRFLSKHRALLSLETKEGRLAPHARGGTRDKQDHPWGRECPHTANP